MLPAPTEGTQCNMNYVSQEVAQNDRGKRRDPKISSSSSSSSVEGPSAKHDVNHDVKKQA